MPELDSLRGVAILLVLFLHGFGYTFNPASFTGLRHMFMTATSYGWIGVHLFFVLSGFLITGILLDSRERGDYYRRFYARRALRILPAYYLLLLILALLHQTYWPGRHSVGIPFVLLSFIYLSNVTPLFGIPMQYTVLWSLAVEEHFYLLWPAVVRRLSRQSLAGAALGIFLLVPMVRAVSAHFGHPADHNFYTWCNADGLALGALLSMALRDPRIGRDLLRNLAICVVAVSGTTLVLAANLKMLRWDSTSGFALRLSILNLGFVALLVLVLLAGTTRWSFIVNIPLLRFFGEISYGLYLCHMLFFYGYERIAKQFWPSLAASDGRFGDIVLQFVCAGSASVIAATLSRRYFEECFLRLRGQPVLRGLRKEHKTESLPVIASANLPGIG